MSSCYYRKTSIHSDSCISITDDIDHLEHNQVKQNSSEKNVELSCVTLKSRALTVICVDRPQNGDVEVFF